MPPGTRRAQGDAARACALKKRGAMTSRPGRMIRRRASEGGDRDSQVVTADHDGPLHLGRHNNTTQQLATDRHVARPGALLVDVATLLGVEGRLEAQTDRLGPTDSHTKSTRNTHLSDYTRARLHRRPPLQTSCCAWALARGVTGVRVFAAAPPPPPPVLQPYPSGVVQKCCSHPPGGLICSLWPVAPLPQRNPCVHAKTCPASPHRSSQLLWTM